MGINKLKKDNKIILEDLGDYNPIEILRTAGKYYIDLAKSPNPREQFRKDLKDAGVDDYLQGASAIPFIGMPFGIASIGLNLGAGNTQQALIQAIITASATLGVSAAGKGFQAAASNPRVAQAVARIIQSVADKMGRLPAIGPKIVTAVGAMRGQLDDLLAELAEVATEEQIAKAEAESNRIKGALDKLAASQPAKKIKKSTAATASGRQKVDYDRVPRSGEIVELYRSPRGGTPGSAKILDTDGNSHEVEISELTPA